MTTTLKTSLQNGVYSIALNRPEVKNAFNDQVIHDFQSVFDDAAKNPDVRVIVISGEGDVFCSGGDLKWMKESLNLQARDNHADTKKLAHMFDTLNTCPKPVVGLVHGAVIGGGVGLASVCDYVIASEETFFSLAEVRVGIIPACIGPFVLAKIGETHARALFISAERFKAKRAFEIGLIHEVVATPADLRPAAERIIKNLMAGGPGALAAAKKLISDLRHMGYPECLDYVAKTLADLRVTPEAQEGLKAFLEKRKPNWVK